MTKVPPQSRRARSMIAAVIAVFAVFATGQVASAHTDFDSSSPTEGAVVEGPLTEVVVNFTNPARPAGEGFELLDPRGDVRSPSSVDETDGTSFVLSFDPPLDSGTYGLRWSVQAGDAHPISGAFQFEVVAAQPPTAAPSVSSPPTTAAVAAVPVVTSPPSATAVAAATSSLDEFLKAGAAHGDAAAIGRIGRIISILGMIFGVGVLAALIWTVRGHRDEVLTHLAWVRLAGLVVFTGGLLEYAALTEADPGAAFATLMATKPGIATMLKMAGGLAVLFGFHQRAGRVVAPAASVSAAAITDLSTRADVTAGSARPHDNHRWTPTSTAAAGLVGYALVLSSFWFDGHTVSKGPWAVHSLVNLVHIGAAAVWGGGVFAMTTVAWMRRRRSERLGIAEMVVRFSSIATVASAAVIVAGLSMVWMVADSPGDVVGTQWGRVLLAKTAVVAVAAALGGYNHFRLRPALERRPDDPLLAKELRVSLLVESFVFVAVVVLTAILVASST